MLGDRFGVIQRRIYHHDPFLRGGFNILHTRENYGPPSP